MITIRDYTISSIVTSTVMGHSGGGMFPLTLLSGYRKLRLVIKEREVTNITKSSTPRKHKGNFRLLNPLTYKYVQRFGEIGLLNAYGLTNDGVEVNAQKIASAIQNGFRVIPSLFPQFSHGQEPAIQEALEAMKNYTRSLGEFFGALELNLSCPNAKEEIKKNMKNALACVEAVRQAYPRLCLIGKISIVHPHEFAQELINAGVDIIHAINTIPYDLICPDGPPSPLKAVGGGGVSGGPAFDQAYGYNKALRRKIKAPMIMGCGVTYLWEADAYFELGADAVSFCTLGRINPDEAIIIIRKCGDYGLWRNVLMGG